MNATETSLLVDKDQLQLSFVTGLCFSFVIRAETGWGTLGPNLTCLCPTSAVCYIGTYLRGYIYSYKYPTKYCMLRNTPICFWICTTSPSPSCRCKQVRNLPPKTKGFNTILIAIYYESLTFNTVIIELKRDVLINMPTSEN